jgi:hypothetical protein
MLIIRDVGPTSERDAAHDDLGGALPSDDTLLDAPCSDGAFSSSALGEELLSDLTDALNQREFVRNR